MLCKQSVFFVTLLLFALLVPVQTPAAQRIDDARYILYLPSGIKPGHKYPLVLALSPGADAESLIKVWRGVSEKHAWIILASKEFRNGTGREILVRLNSLIQEIAGSYPVAKDKIITTGLSGGAMGAHAMALFYPESVSAVIANTGMIHRNHIATRRSEYPKAKCVVFLASPTDFRYEEMKGDKEFLEGLGWKTMWIEFKGGHSFAPEEAYLSAAKWLESQWKER